jgi:hypothetical protein
LNAPFLYWPKFEPYFFTPPIRVFPIASAVLSSILYPALLATDLMELSTQSFLLDPELLLLLELVLFEEPYVLSLDEFELSFEDPYVLPDDPYVSFDEP